MTKRILAGALSLALAAGLLAGCGGSASSAPASSDASPAPQATDTPAPAAAAEADHNILTGSAHSGAQPRPFARHEISRAFPAGCPAGTRQSQKGQKPKKAPPARHRLGAGRGSSAFLRVCVQSAASQAKMGCIRRSSFISRYR